MKKKLTLGVCLLAVLAAPALAILGLGDIVYDPTSFAELVKQFVQMQQQYAQLVQTYQMTQNQYNQMLFMAQQVPVNMVARYRAMGTPWFNSSATNIYGTTGAWTTGINTGAGVGAGYSAATLPLGTYGAGVRQHPSRSTGPHQDRLCHGRAHRWSEHFRHDNPRQSCAPMLRRSKRPFRTLKMTRSLPTRT